MDVVRLRSRARYGCAITVSRAFGGALFPGVSSCVPDHSAKATTPTMATRSEEHTSELQSLAYLVCRLLLEKKKKKKIQTITQYKRTFDTTTTYTLTSF